MRFIYPITCRSFSTFPLIMSTSKRIAVIKHAQGEEKFTFSFLLKYSGNFKVEKQFNLNRFLTEPSSDFMNRLNSGVEKAVSKKIGKKRKNNQGEVEEIDIKARFKIGTQEQEFRQDILIKDVIFHPELKFAVMGQDFDIEVNPPTVTNLKISDCIMADLPVYPEKLEMEFALEETSQYHWYLSQSCFSEPEAVKKKNPKDLAYHDSVRYSGFFFKPSKCDIGRFVKLVCTPVDANGKSGVPAEVFSKSVISAGPGHCPFDTRHCFTKQKSDPDRFRTVTYNLLADLYADSDFSRTNLFPQCPPYALDIKYRKQLILKELLGYNADIMCLQEVDQKIHNRDLSRVLVSFGFQGIFHKKGGEVAEGCSCFWDTSKFELVSEERFVYADLLEDPAYSSFSEVLESNKDLKEQVVNRSTILQTVVLRLKHQPNTYVLIGNTHLYFRPCADNIRLFQAGLAIKNLERKRQDVLSWEKSEKCGLIFCGDFNSSPGNGVLEFVRKGKIDANHSDWKSWEGHEIKGLELKHDMTMDSACGEPKYTNFTQGFADCLDYIFFELSNLAVEEVVPFPTEEELKMHIALPNIVFPSDHIACVSLFGWRK